MLANEAEPSIPATTDETTDNSDAHTIWCNCDECVEILIVDLIEDRADLPSARSGVGRL